MKTKKLNILEELKRRLNNQCSESIKTCPMQIAMDQAHPTLLCQNYIDVTWGCSDCIKMFEGIIDLTKCRDKYNEIAELRVVRPCPCAIAMTKMFNFTTQDVLARLDECIEELEEKLYG